MNPLPLSRREAVRRIIAVSAIASTFGVPNLSYSAEVPVIGGDPNLLKKEIPWPRVLTAEEKRIVTALGDIILPADEFGPAASAVGVPDFIDEWVSAPYDAQRKDSKVIREGLAWIDGEAKKRFGTGFAEAKPEQQLQIVQDIVTEGTEARKKGKSFFMLFRDRAAGGYYTTTEGWKAIGYTGNAPQAEFAGPPPEALKHIGIE